MNYKQCARYLSQLGITLSKNGRGAQLKWTTATPTGQTLNFRTLREAEDHWNATAKQSVYQLSMSRALLISSESLDETSRDAFNEWIDGIQNALPNELFRRGITLESSTATWKFEARMLAAKHGSIANASFTVILKQARHEHLERLSLHKARLQYGRLDQQCSGGAS